MLLIYGQHCRKQKTDSEFLNLMWPHSGPAALSGVRGLVSFFFSKLLLPVVGSETADRALN